MWLGKNESSWNVVLTGDDGKSFGPFGMDSTTALWVAECMGIEIAPKDVKSALENDIDLAADMALWYFEYWYDKYFAVYRHEGLSWTRAVKSYRYGYYPEKASEEFTLAINSWVRFFKKICKN